MDVEKVIREYLPHIVHLSLATAKNNRPWVCEVHFAFDDKLNLYFRSLDGHRHSQEIIQNPHVAGNIVKQHALSEAPVGVYFEGIATRLGPGEDQQTAFACLKERLGIDETALEEALASGGHQFYKITVETYYVFGRFDGDSGQKYQLPWYGGRK